MSSTASKFIGSIPEYYDQGLVPAIFEDYAKLLATEVCKGRPERVLELACGTGVVTALVQAGLPKASQLIASDLNADMFAIAKAKLENSSNVKFQEIDAMEIPFPDGSMDCVFCQFGVMFFPDKVASYREVLRVLKPGSPYLFNVWHSQAENPFAAIVERLVGEVFPDDPPTFYRVPFHYHDAEKIEDDLNKAGFEKISIEERPLLKSIASPEQFAEGLVRGNPISQEIKDRGLEPQGVIDRVHTAFQESFGTEDPQMPLNAIFVSAQKS